MSGEDLISSLLDTIGRLQEKLIIATNGLESISKSFAEDFPEGSLTQKGMFIYGVKRGEIAREILNKLKEVK